MRPVSTWMDGDATEECDRPTLSMHLRRQTARQMAIASLAVSVAFVLVLAGLTRLPVAVPVLHMSLIGIGLWTLISGLLWRGLAWHAYPGFGPANTVTLYRSAGTVLIASLVPAAQLLPPERVWIVTGFAVLLLLLDGVDGYLARRTGLMSVFGARFDMEIDALLILVISAFVWQSGETGPWILSLGLMRYAFVISSFWSRPLRAELFPSFRRKLVCVIQLVALCAILSPLVTPPLSSLVGAFALVCLAASFARDILWLYQHQSSAGASAAQRAPGTVASIDARP